MSFRYVRQPCPTCKIVPPRAAVHRCPICLTPIRRAGSSAVDVCARCDRALPRAHAGRCPACAVAAGAWQ